MVEMGASSSSASASASTVAHLRWKTIGADCLGKRSAADVVVLIERGLDRNEDEGEDSSRNALRRR